MVDGVVGEDGELVTGAAGQATKQKHEHVLILLQLMVEMIAKDIRRPQGIVTLTHVLVWMLHLKLIEVKQISIRLRNGIDIKDFFYFQ